MERWEEKLRTKNRISKKRIEIATQNATRIVRFLPKTMANVFVALRSFFADDFSRFFFDALCTL